MRGIYGLLSLSKFVLTAQLGIQTIRFSDVLSPSVLGQGSFWIPDLSIIITIASFWKKVELAKKIVTVRGQSIVEKNARPKKNVSNVWMTMPNAYQIAHAILDVRTDVLVAIGLVKMRKFMMTISSSFYVSSCLKQPFNSSVIKSN